MMAPEPLRSAMATGRAEDTSLAVPSDDKLRTGQQRVLDQVHTIKRSKSKKSSSSSPTSGLAPQTLTTYTEFGSFKFSPSKLNGTFGRNSSTVSSGYNKVMHTQKSRTLSSKSMGGRQFSQSGTVEQQINSRYRTNPNGLKHSRSDPTLAPPFSSAPASSARVRGQTVQSQQTIQTQANRNSTYSVISGNQLTNSQTRMVNSPSTQHATDGKMGTMKISKTDLQQSAVNSTVQMSEMSIKDAVEFLSHAEENFQQCGAVYIQHKTFLEDGAKQEVYQRGGIPTLVSLLRSPNPEVNQAAAGALRNLVFKDQKNKLEVQHCGGIAKALQLLKETDSTETKKQITGLLWNMSSTDELKSELIATALPALTENVLVPFNSWSENTASNYVHPDVFYNATGCLRNLSSGQKNERKAMRECRGLIDSLMSYLESCVAEEKPDDKSVENCACILHNLTFQLEAESAECFRKLYLPSEGQSKKKKSTVGCFSPKSSKVQKETLFSASPAMPVNSEASGMNWLCHPKAMQVYLSLLDKSQNDVTLEACCGTLQNLTAGKGLGSTSVSQILVEKLGALPHITPMLQSSNKSLQKNAISLLGNMSRISTLQPTIAKQALPDLTSLISSGPLEMGKSDETIATACSTARTLISADTGFSKKIVTNELVASLGDLSENRSFQKGSLAASTLLFSIWNDKNLQSAVKKMGLHKGVFVNDNIEHAVKSYQANATDETQKRTRQRD